MEQTEQLSGGVAPGDSPVRLDRAGVRPEPGHPSDPAWDALLDQTMSKSLVRTVFQPIVDLRRMEPIGYEALTRFELGDMTPDKWFAAAAHRGVVAELEATSIASAARHRDDLPPGCFMSVNLEPESVLHPSIWRTLDRLGDLHGIVIEITEHRELASYDALQPVLDRLRGDGAQIAIDDAGAGHAGLQQILELRPSILKLDRSLVACIDCDAAKAALVDTIGSFANRIGASILAEGVETLGEARELRRLGVPMVQGYLFGRPATPWAPVEPEVTIALDAAWEEDHPGLRPLLEIAPWVGVEELDRAAARLARDSGLKWVVALDEQRRPVGLITATSVLEDEIIQTLTVRCSEEPIDVALRVATLEDEILRPVMVTDEAGRYLGLVTVRRLLGHLAVREIAPLP